EPQLTPEYNAVFKGGGAKGIAYAGAIEACEVAGITFDSAAGSSAGAITAALVACRYSSREITAMMPAALATIDDPITSFVIPARSSLLGSDDLRSWLSTTIADRVHPGWADNSAKPPTSTFAELKQATGASLYVVAMDLATRQPIVFGPELTPDMDIAVAVVASSAIPVAFPPVRVVLDDEIHRVVDGGTWANYPAFVFHDKDFRSFHGLPPATRPTIGFILDDADVEPPNAKAISPASGPKFSSDGGSVIREMGFIGATISSPVFRWMLTLTPLLFIAIASFAIAGEASSGFPTIARAPGFAETALALLLAGTVALASVTALATSVISLRFGREVSDGGVVGAIAAMGVGPSVPYWVGTGDQEHQHIGIRIPVPEELTTLQFRPDDPVVEAAVQAGYAAAIEALSDAGFVRACDEQAILDWQAEMPPPPKAPPKRHPWDRGVLRPIFLLATAPVRVYWTIYVRWPMWMIRNARRNRLAWLATVLGSALIAVAMIGFGLQLIIHDRQVVGTFLLLSSGLPSVFCIWILTARKAELGALPYPSLGKLPTPVLLIIAALSLPIAGVFVNILADEISIVGLTNSETTGGLIVDANETAVLVALATTADEAEFLGGLFSDDAISVPVVDFATLDQLTKDVDGVEIAGCRPPFACLEFSTTNTVDRIDEPVLVHFDVGTGTAFLDEDRDSVWPFMSAALSLIVSATLVSLAFHCWQVTVWRRSQQSLIHSTSEPPRPSAPPSQPPPPPRADTRPPPTSDSNPTATRQLRQTRSTTAVGPRQARPSPPAPPE
ncbi:MAG: hypothetical protein HKN91_11655, partial [Acidimicrobiia bacterium]|nr:hypothetical protein [Acidimicrobiia bacterium]